MSQIRFELTCGKVADAEVAGPNRPIPDWVQESEEGTLGNVFRRLSYLLRNLMLNSSP